MAKNEKSANAVTDQLKMTWVVSKHRKDRRAGVTSPGTLSPYWDNIGKQLLRKFQGGEAESHE